MARSTSMIFKGSNVVIFPNLEILSRLFYPSWQSPPVLHAACAAQPTPAAELLHHRGARARFSSPAASAVARNSALVPARRLSPGRAWRMCRCGRESRTARGTRQRVSHSPAAIG
jgi:hypothetical protein